AGAAIRYRPWGGGPGSGPGGGTRPGADVLLIHGSPGSLEDWAPLVEPLAASHRVTAYDRTGHGYSGDAGNQSTYEYHADVALGLIDALGLKDVIVVGHSYGGGTALAMAIRNPASVKAFVIVDAAAYRMRDPEPLYRLLALPVF